MNSYENPTILIVDDIAQNIQIVANILKQEGYKIRFAKSGKSALEHAKKKPLDLILLDIMMPEMNGYEVCQKLKQQEVTKDIPVIFLTALDEAIDIARGFEVGGIDYITKPFNQLELIARVETHIKLKKKETALIQANATKDKFLSIITHDLKNPFNTLLGFSKLLLKNHTKYDETKREHLIQLIYDSSKRGNELLQNLIQWSHAQTGRLKFNPIVLHLQNMVESVIYELATTAEKKKIQITSKIDKDLRVVADEPSTKTILRNLISNAIKFTHKKGEIKIISTKLTQNQTKYIEIAIIDNGVGIAEADQKKIFILKEQHTTTGTDAETGTGLGLILCKEFVKQNHGTIYVQSTQGKGSRFAFTLPAFE